MEVDYKSAECIIVQGGVHAYQKQEDQDEYENKLKESVIIGYNELKVGLFLRYIHKAKLSKSFHCAIHNFRTVKVPLTL